MHYSYQSTDAGAKFVKLIPIKPLLGHFHKNFYEFFEPTEDVFKIYPEEDFIPDTELPSSSAS